MAEKLSGKKVVMIVANEFEDIELLYPLLRLSEEGAEIVVVPVQMGNHPRPGSKASRSPAALVIRFPFPLCPRGDGIAFEKSKRSRPQR